MATSCLDFRPPTLEESTLNPTQTIQYEFQEFYQKYRKELRGKLFKDSEFHRLMYDKSSTTCSRTSFYLSLFQMNKIDRETSIHRIQICATNGVNGILNPVNPVDAAIKCYSILISNLITGERRVNPFRVCDFLMQDYVKARAEDLQSFLNEKIEILALILGDTNAYAAAPQGIKDEILRELRDGGRLPLILTRGVYAQAAAQAAAILAANPLPPFSAYSKTAFKAGILPTKLNYSDDEEEEAGPAGGPAGMGGKRKSKKSKSKSKSKIAKKSSKKNMKKSLRLKKKSKISRKNK